MSWLSCFVGDRQAEAPRQLPRLCLGLLAERKAQQIELRARGRGQKIALVALGLARAIERTTAVRQRPRRHIVAGGQNAGAKLACGSEKVAELDRLVAFEARHRRLAGDVTVGEAIDHRLLEAALVVEHVMRNADAFGNGAGIVNIAAGATGPLAMGRRAMVVELQRDPDDVVPGVSQKRRRNRGVDPARHGDDHPGG